MVAESGDWARCWTRVPAPDPVVKSTVRWVVLICGAEGGGVGRGEERGECDECWGLTSTEDGLSSSRHLSTDRRRAFMKKFETVEGSRPS